MCVYMCVCVGGGGGGGALGTKPSGLVWTTAASCGGRGPSSQPASTSVAICSSTMYLLASADG